MTYFKYLILGVAISVLLLLILSSFPRQAVLYFLALFLAATAASYAGAALAERRSSRTTRLETAAFVAVFASALAGLLVSPLWIAIGYAAHGIWDFFHHPRRVGAEVVHWFPPLCLSFDFVLAIFISLDFLAVKM